MIRVRNATGEITMTKIKLITKVENVLGTVTSLEHKKNDNLVPILTVSAMIGAKPLEGKQESEYNRNIARVCLSVFTK